ncbi:MAG: hypothetical protein ACK559_39630, partial [bacterium]
TDARFAVAKAVDGGRVDRGGACVHARPDRGHRRVVVAGAHQPPMAQAPNTTGSTASRPPS